MDIEVRKIRFVQEFLKLQNAESISRLEYVLNKEQEATKVHAFDTMTREELNTRIDISESDFEKGRYKSSSEMLVHQE